MLFLRFTAKCRTMNETSRVVVYGWEEKRVIKQMLSDAVLEE